MPERLPTSIRNRVIPLLGTMPDYQIARMSGCSASFVYQLEEEPGPALLPAIARPVPMDVPAHRAARILL